MQKIFFLSLILSLSSFSLDDLDYQIKKINKAFLKLDKILSKIIIRIEKIEDDNIYFINDTNLLDFLKEKTIDSDELLYLFENGALRTKNDFLIKLRTGDSFADILGLQEQIYLIVNKAIEEGKFFSEDLSLLSIFSGENKKKIIKIFEESNLAWERIIFDAKNLEKLRRIFMFFNIINLSSFKNLARPGRTTGVDTNNNLESLIDSNYLSFEYFGNLFFLDKAKSLTFDLAINNAGLTNSGTFNSSDFDVAWWNFYSEGYLGAGISYNQNFEEFFNWPQQGFGFSSFGLYGNVWKNKFGIGGFYQQSINKTWSIGPEVSFNLGKKYELNYLGKYPLDGKIPSIRGLNRLEISLKRQKEFSFGLNGIGINNLGQLPVAFTAGKKYTKQILLRTHVHDDDFKKIKKKYHFPKFEEPFSLKEGDELVAIKIGVLKGAFIIGLNTIEPIFVSKVGTSVDVKAEYELSIKRLPDDRFEVSIEVNKLLECNFFKSLFNVIGFQSVKSIAFAKKQIFLFNSKKEDAKKALFSLIREGILPISEDLNSYGIEQDVQYLMSRFKNSNDHLKKIGVLKTYVEEVKIKGKKFFAGLVLPVIPAFLNLLDKIDKKMHIFDNPIKIIFEGLGLELIKASSKSIATNGILAVERTTHVLHKAFKKGFKGLSSKQLFLIHRRLHSLSLIKDNLYENKWVFDALIIQANLNYTILNTNKRLRLIKKLNNLFDTYFDTSLEKEFSWPQTLKLEEDITNDDLYNLAYETTRENIQKASLSSQIPEEEIYIFLNSLKGANSDEQALITEYFIKKQKGLRGFSCLHQLLKSDPKKLLISIEGEYESLLNKVNKFLVTYKNTELEDIRLVILNAESKKDKKYIRKFYQSGKELLKNIDEQLKNIENDPFFLDENNTTIFNSDSIKELILKGLRQDKNEMKAKLNKAKNAVFIILNIKEQGYSLEERIKIYKIANNKSEKK